MLAQYSVLFCIALALFRDPRDPRSFDREAIQDPKIWSMVDKIQLGREELATYGSKASSVRFNLKDGRVLSRRLTTFKGTPELPPTRGDVREKFMLLTRDCPEAGMSEIFERRQNLEREKTLDWLKA